MNEVHVDDPRLTFLSQGPPQDGDVCYLNRWWVRHPERGLVVWKHSPQCNSYKVIPNKLLRLYPWAEVVFVELAYVPQQVLSQ